MSSNQTYLTSNYRADEDNYLQIEINLAALLSADQYGKLLEAVQTIEDITRPVITGNMPLEGKQPKGWFASKSKVSEPEAELDVPTFVRRKPR